MGNPIFINILGKDYEVVKSDNLLATSECYGQIFYPNQQIIIDSSVSKDRQNETLIHEVIHGIFENLAFYEESKNEHLIQSLSVGLYQAFKNNFSVAEM